MKPSRGTPCTGPILNRKMKHNADFPQSVITLTTDFGWRDYYVGSIKGAILTINGAARIIDISHDLDPFNVAAGAFMVGSFYSYFPKGSIHVVVVDPGVGGSRRPILVEAQGHWFIGPDNGVLSDIYRQAPPTRIIHLTRQAYFLQGRGEPVGATFHGRDLFAPWLSRGVEADELGEPADRPVILDIPQPQFISGKVEARVIYIDRFGNLITNLRSAHLDPILRKGGRAVRITLGSHALEMTRFYGELPVGEAGAILNSNGHLEIYVNQGSAAKQLGGRYGDPVTVEGTGPRRAPE